MGTKLVSVAWNAMMGTVDLNTLIASYFEPEGYTVSLQPLTYPNGIFRTASKILRTDDGTELHLNTRLSTRGYVIWRIEVELEDYHVEIDQLRFSLSDLGVENKSLYEIHVELIYQMFGNKSIIELYKGALLQDEEFKGLLERTGITFLHDQVHLNMYHYYLTDEKEVFEELQEISSEPDLTAIEGVDLPAEKGLVLPGLNAEIYFGREDVLYYNDGYEDLTRQIYEGMHHFKIATYLLQTILYLIDNKLYELLQYIKEVDDVSWVYVQERLYYYEIHYQEILQEFESNYTKYKNFNGINYQDPDFLETLALYVGYNQLLEDYHNLKRGIVEKQEIVSDMLKDKGEKEEREANESLIQLIGILAIIEVISEFLPILPQQSLFWIRLTGLLIIFPLLALVWYRTQWLARKRKQKADQLKKKNELEDLHRNISQFHVQLEQQSLSTSSGYLQELYDRELPKLAEIKDEIKQKLDNLE